jgi:hypothetical protein
VATKVNAEAQVNPPPQQFELNITDLCENLLLIAANISIHTFSSQFNRNMAPIPSQKQKITK